MIARGKFSVRVPMGRILQARLEVALPTPRTTWQRCTALCSDLVQRHDTWLVTLASALAGSLALAYFYGLGLVTSLAEARGRLLIARGVIEGIQTGPFQLGATWLPLPQALMVPLVWNDFLFHSGLAGAIVSVFSYVLAVTFLYKLIVLLAKSRLAALVGLVAFSTPNLLFLQAVPTSKLPFIALLVASIYFLAAWTLQPTGVRNLLLLGLLVLLVTLTRYEGWVLLPLVAVVVVFTLRAKGFAYHKAEGYFVFFATFACFGVVLWLLWNLAIFGNPIYFTHSQYPATNLDPASIAAQFSPRSLAGAFMAYATASINAVGWISCLLAAGGAAYWLASKHTATTKAAVLLLLFPLPLFVLTTLNGQEQGGTSLYAVTSYGVLAAPGIGFLAGYLASRMGRLSIPVLTLALASVLLVGLGGPSSVTEANIASADGATQAQQSAGTWLHVHYSGGLLLRQRFDNEPSVFASQIPLDQVVYEGDRDLWAQDLAHPEYHNVTWIYMRGPSTIQGPSASLPADQVWAALHNSSDLAENYYLAYQHYGIEIYVRNPAEASS